MDTFSTNAAAVKERVTAAEKLTDGSKTANGTSRFRRETGVRLVLTAVLAVLLAACGNGVSGVSNKIPADFPITVYTGTEVLGGAQVDFSDLRGRPVVLNFWAGLCPPCRAEMPDLQQFYDEYQDRIVMIGIDVGQFTGLGNQEDARDLLAALEISYPTGFTLQRNVIEEYGVLTMPTTVFITSEGKVFRKWSGVLGRDDLVDIADEMLGLGPG